MFVDGVSTALLVQQKRESPGAKEDLCERHQPDSIDADSRLARYRKNSVVV